MTAQPPDLDNPYAGGGSAGRSMASTWVVTAGVLTVGVFGSVSIVAVGGEAYATTGMFASVDGSAGTAVAVRSATASTGPSAEDVRRRVHAQLDRIGAEHAGWSHAVRMRIAQGPPRPVAVVEVPVDDLPGGAAATVGAWLAGERRSGSGTPVLGRTPSYVPAPPGHRPPAAPVAAPTTSPTAARTTAAWSWAPEVDGRRSRVEAESADAVAAADALWDLFRARVGSLVDDVLTGRTASAHRTPAEDPAWPGTPPAAGRPGRATPPPPSSPALRTRSGDDRPEQAREWAEQAIDRFVHHTLEPLHRETDDRVAGRRGAGLAIVIPSRLGSVR